MTRRQFKNKIIGACVLFICFAFIFLFFYWLTNGRLSLFYNKGYQPEQSIPFSHKLHAGEYKIDCRYCHTGVETSRSSLLPSLNICMNCHRTVKTDSPWIKKITEAYNQNKPIVWEKVNLLPDFARFSHFHHIEAGKECKTCHGAVETMTEVYQFKDLSMGWCIKCHKEPEESKKVVKDLKDTPHSQAPVDCFICHH